MQCFHKASKSIVAHRIFIIDAMTHSPVLNNLPNLITPLLNYRNLFRTFSLCNYTLEY